MIVMVFRVIMQKELIIEMKIIKKVIEVIELKEKIRRKVSQKVQRRKERNQMLSVSNWNRVVLVRFQRVVIIVDITKKVVAAIRMQLTNIVLNLRKKQKKFIINIV